MPKSAKAAPRSSSSSPSKPRLAIAILAAGKGTRLKSRYPKVLHHVAGKPLLQHVVGAATQVVPARDVYAIIGHDAGQVRQVMEEAGSGIRFILQEEQRGTGHALQVARPQLQAYDHVIVLSGDVPLVRPQTIQRLRDFHLQHHAAMTVTTATPPDPAGYGRVIRGMKNRPPSDRDEVAAIVEEKALTAAQRKVREINAGIYAFATGPLFAHIDQLTTDNVHREFYLTDMASILARAGERVLAWAAADFAEVLGINTRAELARLDAMLRQRKCAQLMASGVTIFRPETCVIDAEVSAGPDTVIEPFVQLLGNTRLGAECRIRSYSIIANSQLADRVLVRPGCLLDRARVAAGAILGPYCHLRPGSEIGEDAHIGNFVETKQVRMGKGSKANHLTYLGDAQIGAGVNVGAGTITCNYDGVRKYQTLIEDGVFIGSDVTLVAPVKIGRDAYIGAASCVTDDVPPESLALGRGRQVIKPGWVRARRESQAATHKAKS